MVDHTILVDKLVSMSINSQIIHWYKAFLENRTYKVKNDDAISSSHTINRGIPQGTVSAAVLFTIYINDLLESLGNSCVAFADDVTIIEYRNPTDNTNYKLIDKINIIQKWSNDNYMKINCKKTNHLIIKGKYASPTPIFKIFDNKIDTVSSAKILGLYIDSNLNWHNHIIYVKNKIRKIIFFIQRNFRVFSTNNKVHLFNILAQPIIDYANIVWINDYVGTDKCLNSIYKLAARVFTKQYDRNLCATRIVNLIDLPNWKRNCYINEMKFIYSSYNDILTNNFLNINKASFNGHRDHNKKIFINRYTKTKTIKSTFYTAIKKLNSLPEDIVNSDNIDEFVSKIKNSDNYYNLRYSCNHEII
jgi:hypothetical protein